MHGPRKRHSSTTFITDLTSTGTVTNKTYLSGTTPANSVLITADANHDSITVHFDLHAPDEGAFTPVATIGAVTATLTRVEGRDYTGEATIDGSGDLDIVVVTNDGGRSNTLDYTRALDPPLVLTAIFDDQGSNADPYPAIQTQVKSGDTLAISGTAEVHADSVYVLDEGVDTNVTRGQGVQGPFAVSAMFGTWSGTINVGSGDSGVAVYKCFAEVTGGDPGATKTSDETVVKDQTAPAFSSAGFAYPGTQEAIKDSETVDVTITHTNLQAGDTYLYDENGTGELSIPATTAYSVSKTLTRISGNYRETGTNYRLTATRTTLNGQGATKTVTVKIAHVAPVVSVLGATSRLGTDDGTNAYRDHTVTLRSSQANLSTHSPSLSAPQGTWQGSWSASGDLDYTRALRIADADIVTGGQVANDYSWGACSISNRAGKGVIVVTTNPDYSLGGFQERSLPMAQFQEYETAGTFMVDATSVGCEAWDSADTSMTSVLAYKANTTQNDGGREFTITDSAGNFDVDGNYVRCTDGEIFNLPYTLRVEETA